MITAFLPFPLLAGKTKENIRVNSSSSFGPTQMFSGDELMKKVIITSLSFFLNISSNGNVMEKTANKISFIHFVGRDWQQF